jgi:hypothetical protein
VVSIVSKCGDFAWQSMESKETGADYVRGLADKYITEDGTGGHFAALLSVNVPIVFHTHWQSLYSNGRMTGLKALAMVFERVATLWQEKVAWMKCSALAERIMHNP